MNNAAYNYEQWDEKLDGKIILMSPRAAVKHNVAAGNIYNIFKNYLKGKPCQTYNDVDVFLTDNDRVVPDVMIVCNKDIVKEDGVYGAPDLIVEVLSPGTANRDKGYKMKLYEQCGIKEYWLVDTNSCSIEVYLHTNGRYELDYIYSVFPDYYLKKMTDQEKSEIIHEFKTSLFDDMIIKLADVFED
ncbi:MAG: Uma2 family endonuclease [Oscillospiraceae bacterium]|nr:Uma2 family endonuclease [Oscillospiraceae bacterium]